MTDKLRNSITISTQEGNEEDYLVEAMFEVNGDSYALLKNENDDLHLVQVDEQVDQ